MDERLNDLETKVAYLEHGLSELDDVVRGLSEKLDLVHRELVRLHMAEEGRYLESTKRQDKPPHY